MISRIIDCFLGFVKFHNVPREMTFNQSSREIKKEISLRKITDFHQSKFENKIAETRCDRLAQLVEQLTFNQ